MTDVVLNLNCSEHAIYSRILSGCVYIIKYGLTSPEIFLRRVHKRQAKRLRKRGININVSGSEYAIAENILTDLKVLPAPLIPATLYPRLRQLLDIYGHDARSKFISEAFNSTSTDPVNVYVLQALLKTMNLLATFENSWNCACGKMVEGNGSSWTMVALPITSYILREKCATSGHWFVSWGQMASDVEVIKILISHWRDIKIVSPSVLPTIKPTLTSTVQAWYCHLTNNTHAAIEPNEIPVFEVENIINPISFKPARTGDFEITLYEEFGKESHENYDFGDENLNTDFESLITFDNMESLQSIKDKLDYGSLYSECTTESSEFPDVDEETSKYDDEKTSEDFLEDYSEVLPEEDSELTEVLVGNILSGCGGGSFDMWADFSPPSPDTVVSSNQSLSYWSNHTDISRREFLVLKIREAVLRTFREARNRLKIEPDLGIDSHDEKQSDLEKQRFEIDRIGFQSIKPTASTPIVDVQSNFKEKGPARSRILELLVKANPITDIRKLEKLADKLYPSKKSATAYKTNKSKRRGQKSNQSSQKNNTFDKPPHLIKEFVPRCKEGASCLTQDLQPITLTETPLKNNLTYQYQYGYSNQQSLGSIDEIGASYWTEGQYYQADYLSEPRQLYPGQQDSLSGVQMIPVPPIPEQLQSSTPPNLPTIVMLSQLFTSNNFNSL